MSAPPSFCPTPWRRRTHDQDPPALPRHLRRLGRPAGGHAGDVRRRRRRRGQPPRWPPRPTCRRSPTRASTPPTWTRPERTTCSSRCGPTDDAAANAALDAAQNAMFSTRRARSDEGAAPAPRTLRGGTRPCSRAPTSPSSRCPGTTPRSRRTRRCRPACTCCCSATTSRSRTRSSSRTAPARSAGW